MLEGLGERTGECLVQEGSVYWEMVIRVIKPSHVLSKTIDANDIAFFTL